MKIHKAAFLIIIVASLSSCIVSKKKYDELNSRKSDLEVALAECNELSKELTKDTTEMSETIGNLTSEKENLIVDTAKLGFTLRDLSGRHKKLMRSANADAKNLGSMLEKVGKLNGELETKEKELEKKDLQLQEDQAKIDSLNNNLEAREKRIAELEARMKEQESAVGQLKDKVSKALLSFNDDELKVELKNGKVYVSLAEDLIFKSGSYTVETKGQGAIKKLANALKDNNDIDIVVEGHTDDVPMRGSGPISDNWDLSVRRATSIVKVLTKAGVVPTHVTAAGRGEHLPKVEGKTKEARAKNRRTEIIISPKLDELFKLLDTSN